MLQRVISGGQTGVDRAALDAALMASLELGGSCPRPSFGSWTDPIRYPLTELPTRTMSRTHQNVNDGDGTLVLTLARSRWNRGDHQHASAMSRSSSGRYDGQPSRDCCAMDSPLAFVYSMWPALAGVKARGYIQRHWPSYVRSFIRSLAEPGSTFSLVGQCGNLCPQPDARGRPTPDDHRTLLSRRHHHFRRR